MTRSLLRAIAFAALFLLGACGEAPPWGEPLPLTMELRASATPSSVRVLEPFDLVLDLFVRKDIAFEFDPKVPEGFVGSIERAPERVLGHGRWVRAVLHLRAAVEPGERKLPPFSARATDGTVQVATDERALTVASVLAEASPELEDPAPLLEPAPVLWPWLAGGALVAALALLAREFVRRRPQPSLSVHAEVEAPHQRALRELQRLRAAPRTTDLEVDAFYVAVSQVLRVYLEGRFGLRAPERTTEEFLAEVERGGPLSVLHCLELRRFLSQCDLVKFAAQVPTAQTHLETLAIAEQFVETTRPDRVPAANGGAA